MNYRLFCRILCILILICSAYAIPAQAEDRALLKLLELFQNKGVLTGEEIGLVKQVLAEEEATYQRWEADLTAREKALQEKEASVNSPSNAEAAPEPAPLDPPPHLMTSRFKDGLTFTTEDPAMFSLTLGARLQFDYRTFRYDTEGDPAVDKFDLRRARLRLSGRAMKRFGYKFEYEFEGAGARRLLDAYADINVFPELRFRAGQFNQPFGLEQSSSYEAQLFAEPSMGQGLAPGRDLGVMLLGSAWHYRVDYQLAVFNGDGEDGSTGGDEDSPQLAARVVLSPAKGLNTNWLENFQVGASARYAHIDRNNIDLTAKTSGLTTFFDIGSSSKFHIVYDVDTLRAMGIDLGWAVGPVMFAGEYAQIGFRDIATSSTSFDFDVEAYYASILWMLTGEEPCFRNGQLQPIAPLKSVWRDGFGALGLAFRYDYFGADEHAYDNLINPGTSVREAHAYTVAVNWYLDSNSRLVVDYTRTAFDRPLLVDRDSRLGTAYYSDSEEVITLRYQFGF